MKNQYNFLKSIDNSSSSSGTEAKGLQIEENKAARLNKASLKSSLSGKLQELVASRLSLAASFSEQTKGRHEKKEERNDRTLFSLSSASHNSNNNEQALNKKPADKEGAIMQQAATGAGARQLERPLGGGGLSLSRKKVVPLNDENQAQPATNATASPTPAISEKLAPEMARCYDEIDQIYDYIRGLAPLPMQLRKIKSIDFEQLEREKRYQQIEAANSKLIASHNQQQQQQRLQLKQQQTPVGSQQGEQRAADAVGAKQTARLPSRPIKVRQREADDAQNEQLKVPTSGDHLSAAKKRIEGPLPIKVVTTSCNERPNIKRVESLNLGGSSSTNNRRLAGEPADYTSDTTKAVLSAGSQSHHHSQKPAYLISSAQRGQLFRLPRAHSTSTLNKSGERAPDSYKKSSGRRQLAEEDEGDEPADVNARTLPPLRLSRVAIVDQSGSQTASLGRLGVASPKQASNSKQRQANKQTDLVESFVDDNSSDEDDDSSQSSSSSASSSSSSASSSSASSSPATSSSSDQTTSSHLSNRRTSQSASAAATDSSKSDRIQPVGRTKRTSTGETVAASLKSDKWAEKSHSDYENDTVSLSSATSGETSGSLSDLLRSSGANNKGRIRRSSSGTGTAGAELTGEFPQDTASSRSKPAAKRLAEEHIYEQIPAHKNLAAKQHLEALDRPRSLPHKHLLDSTYSQFRHHQRQQRGHNNVAGLAARPYNYPVVYTPNVAPAKQHQRTAYLTSATGPPQPLRASVHNLAAIQHHRLKSSPGGGTYPLPVSALHLVPQQQQQQQSNSYRAGRPPARLLDERHGMSMNNLHLLPYLGQPIVGVYRAGELVRQQPGADARLNRASSSSKVNRIRAPRLSPAQLISQIQMPRAVSKRQQEFSQFTAPPVDTSRRPVFVWKTGNSGELLRSDQLGYPRRYKPDQQQYHQPGRGEVPLQRAARRLTAIGIGVEEALEQCRQAGAAQQLGAAPNRARAFEAPPISGRTNPPVRVSKPVGGYFEPPQLLKAPLIDDDDPISTGSSDERADCAAGAPGKSGNKLLAHQQAAAFIQARCLNSVSDLRSFSSTSDEASDSPPTTSSDSPGASSAQANKADKKANKGDFVSSRSFIKCYYGRDERTKRAARPEADNEPAEEAAPSSERQQVAASQTGQQADSAVKAAKKKGGHRLLGLIGMSSGKQTSGDKLHSTNKSASGSESSQAPSQQRSQAPASLATSPIAAMFVAAQQGAANRAQAHPTLMGDFLDTEGPILVRDKRIAALRSNLVRHYQHPIVQVAKVPNFAPKSRAEQAVVEQQQPQQVAPRRRSSASRALQAVQLSQSGSTNTTNSTSSYEAAIKNSQQGAGQVEAIEADLSEPVKYSNRLRELTAASSKKAGGSGKSAASSGQALIKVPKLSKQSHLLNRPLPKPPQQQTHLQTSRRAAALHQSSVSASATKQHQALTGSSSTSNRLAPALASKRKALVSTNLDSSASGGRFEAARSGRPSGDMVLGRAESSAKARPQSTGNRPVSGKEQPKAGASSLSPLAVSIATHPSPTVTTCTSSGISSRLTAATTHLAGNSNSSSQRSAAGSSDGKTDEQRVKSFSELHKQAKAAAAAAAGDRSTATTSSGVSTGGGESLSGQMKLNTASFALMDDSETQPSSPDNDELADKLFDAASGKEDDGDKGELSANQFVRSTKRSKKEKDKLALSSNLKLFDERFSSKFMDGQLASSNDSLLESINYSGTLNRKLQVAARQR